MDAPADDDTQRTGSAGSLISGLTSLENETDDFGKKLLQYERDERRMNGALRNNQPFKRARPNTRVALTLENLERNQDVDLTPRANAPPTNGHRRSRSPTSSEQSDPPVNIPREWGRKGKQGTEWLNRIKTADELVDSEDWQKGDTIYPYKTTFTGDDSPRSVDWAAAAADIPIPSVEDTPSPAVQLRRHSTSPAAVRQRTTSLDRLREWEMSDDFTVGSLLTSTPAIPKRSKALDEVRRREIENLNRRAVASSRLDQIREQSPENTRRPSTARSFPENDAADVTSRAEEFSIAYVPGHSDDRRRSTHAIFETANNPPTTKDLQTRASNENLRSVRYTTPPNATLADRVSKLTRESQNQRPNPQRHESREQLPAQVADSVSRIKKEGTPKRPDHERSDSRELLRQLARVTSASPSPVKSSNTQSQRSRDDSRPSPLSNTANNLSKKNSDQKEDDNVSAVPDMGRLPDDVVIPSEDHPMDPNTLRQADASVISKTPRVTGAWIDTPGTRKSPRNLLPSWTSSLAPRNLFRSKSKAVPEPASEEHPPPEQPHVKQEEQQLQARSRRPASALAAILEDARKMSGGERPPNPNSESAPPSPINNSHGDLSPHLSPKPETDTLGDSTIGSLQDIIDPTLDYTDTLELPNVVDTELQNLQDIQSKRQLTQAERDRRQEILSLKSMNVNLRNVKTSIKDIHRGIKRVEKRVGATENKSSASTPRKVADHGALYLCSAHSEGLCPNCGLTVPHMHAVQQITGTHKDLSQYSIHREGLCQACGRTAPHVHSRPGWLQLWTEFRSLFCYWELDSSPSQSPSTASPASTPNLRITRLGRFVLLFILWYALENYLAYVAFPRHYGYEGRLEWNYYYDKKIPVFPFAIPTLILRPLYYIFLKPWSHIWQGPFYRVYDKHAPWLEAIALDIEWQWKKLVGWGYGPDALTWRMYREWQWKDRRRRSEDREMEKKIARLMSKYGKATPSLTSLATTVATAVATAIGRMGDDQVLR